MARPAKPVELQSRHNTKTEIEKRQREQDRLKGDVSEIEPPFKLSGTQSEIFYMLVEAYRKAGVLGELDCYIIAEGAVVIDRLSYIEEEINRSPETMFSDKVRNTRKEYDAKFFRICNEPGLSPQSRAKLGSLALQKDKDENDPVLKLFGGGQT